MELKERLESLGGTVVPITVNGVDFFAVGFRTSHEVDLYGSDGELIANASFYDNTETATVIINGVESAQPQLYFEHAAKMEFDLAEDVGKYLAGISF